MFDRDRFIADCHDALAQARPATVIRDCVARAVAEPSEIEAALGRPDQGGLFTLHHSATLTILNIVWAPGMTIYPHEHGMWADNTFYRRGPHGLVTAGGKRLERTDTALLGETVIHAVANPLRAFTGAIHVYGGDFFGAPRSEWTPDTLVERPFDAERARRVYAEANDRWRREGP